MLKPPTNRAAAYERGGKNVGRNARVVLMAVALILVSLLGVALLT
jgi:hypothetical protein